MTTEQKPLETVGFGPHTTASEAIVGFNLQGKTVVITGGHSGIGLETTRVLSGAGAQVVVGARDVNKAQAATAGMKDVEVLALNLSDPISIDLFAFTAMKKHPTVDILINNAGIMAPPLARDPRGFEIQFATNHLGHFQLTTRLWPALVKAKSARVINLSSAGHRFAAMDFKDPNFNDRPYEKWAAYGQSKTANSLFSVELDRRGQPYGVRAFAVHPGRIVGTDLLRYQTEDELKATGFVREKGVLKSNASEQKDIPQGAATTVWCATSPLLEGQGGVYCADCNISPVIANDSQNLSGVRRWAIDPITAKELWSLTEKLLGFEGPA